MRRSTQASAGVRLSGAGRRPAGGAWTRRCPRPGRHVLADLGGSAPDAGYIDIFKLKYDYHNAKAVLKAAAVGNGPERGC